MQHGSSFVLGGGHCFVQPTEVACAGRGVGRPGGLLAGGLNFEVMRPSATGCTGRRDAGMMVDTGSHPLVHRQDGEVAERLKAAVC